MQPLHTQRSRHSNLSYPRANGWLLKDARPAHHHPYARYALVNLCCALLAGNHHISRNSQHLAANLVLAGFSLLVLVNCRVTS
jgi:hypothetical protein